MYSVVNIVSEVFHFLFSVKVSSHDIVGFNESVKFSLEILVLLGQECGVFLKSLVFGLQVKVSVHEGLVGVVDGLEVSILSSLFDLK